MSYGRAFLDDDMHLPTLSIDVHLVYVGHVPVLLDVVFASPYDDLILLVSVLELEHPPQQSVSLL